MSFTSWLAVIYSTLIVLAVLAFRRKLMTIGYALLALMITGIIVLGYLWMTSPM